MSHFPAHGELGYLQIPTGDIVASARFYSSVFGWDVDEDNAGFTAPGLIGQFVADRPAATGAGPVLWLVVDDIAAALHTVTGAGGVVHAAPVLDGGERWLVEADDPAGNRVGLVAMVRPVRPQPLIAVRDVEASSRWYQELLGAESDHGGPHYERLVVGGALVLQLHAWDVEHDHNRIGDPEAPVGNGVLLWFGDVADIEAAVGRAERLGAPVVLPLHRNPPAGEGNGPAHREIWVTDPDGYTVVLAGPDGEAFELTP